MEVSSQGADYNIGFATKFTHKRHKQEQEHIPGAGNLFLLRQGAPAGVFVLIRSWQYYERLLWPVLRKSSI